MLSIKKKIQIIGGCDFLWIIFFYLELASMNLYIYLKKKGDGLKGS